MDNERTNKIQRAPFSWENMFSGVAKQCFYECGPRIAGAVPGSVVAATENVLLTRLTVDRPALLELRLGAANPLDLPIAPGHTAAALTLQRDANAWLDNAAVLLECDAGISPSYALRGVQLDHTTSRVRFVNATDPGRFVCPMVAPHPIYGAAAVGSRLCAAADGGPDDWRFDSKTGTVRLSQFRSSQRQRQRQRQHQHQHQQRQRQQTPCLELVYSTNKTTDFVLFARDCSAASASATATAADDSNDGGHDGMSNQFAIVNSSIAGGSREPARFSALPEGGSSMLKAVRMNNKTAPGALLELGSTHCSVFISFQAS